MASAQEAKQIIQSLDGLGTLFGKNIKHSAKRLLYELLRYTSRRTFAKASENNESPFVAFKIHPNRIVIDCNNDDLTKADLEVICQSGSKEQIKQANFKTIIIATKKAHVQSGNFSFEFQHNIFDFSSDGVNSDVTRPIWVTPAENIPDNSTRITLYLHDQGSEKDIQNLRNVIISQFEGLQEECLLFLKHLRAMRIEFYDKGGKMHQAKVFRKHTVDEYRVSLRVTTIDNGQGKAHNQLYHVIEQSADALSTNIMLAFPLTDGFEVLSDANAKKLFNFVPLQTSLLGFHVHSDFDFEDDRHHIVATSAYNLSIRDQIANAFFRAVLQFLEHRTLRYHWPLFLTPKGRDLDPFWSGLDADIRSWITQNPVLMSRHLKHWRLISHLALLSKDAQDESGSPLLDVPINDMFLSSKYPPTVTATLKQYGLAVLSSGQFLKLLELHFNDPNLRLLTMNRTPKWHGALARLLSRLCSNETYCKRIKLLPVLKLRDGSLTSTTCGPVYFPTTENIDIPENLTMRIVDSNSAGHVLYPRALYQQLGVMEATVLQVRSLILKDFHFLRVRSLQVIKSYLRYLYLTHQSFNVEHEQFYREVEIMTFDKLIKRPWESFIYLPGMDHPYTPERLLGFGTLGQSHWFKFLHPNILKDAPEQPSIFHPPWNKWLCDCLGIRESLSLIQLKTLAEQESDGDMPSTTEKIDILSEEYRYVFNHHPNRFLGFFQHRWAFDGPRLLKSPTLVSKVQRLPAQNLCVVTRLLKLQDTWVPLKELKDCVKHYMEYPGEFPFLKIEEKHMDLAIATKWSFLTKHFGVRWKNDMDFLLGILGSIKHLRNGISDWQTAKVIQLYTTIRARFPISTDDEKERARDFFEDSGILYIDKIGTTWTGPSSCLWTAPPDMAAAYSLRSFYEDKIEDKQQMDILHDMFHVDMGIRDATVKDLVEELILLRNGGCKDVTRVAGFYKHLDEQMIDVSEIRNAFYEHDVILVKRDALTTWLSASECFWSEAETTQLNSSLKGCYPHLREFFLGKLGINISSYDKLLDSTLMSLEDTKRNMLSLMDETNGSMPEFPVEPIRGAKIFPVSYPDRTDQPLRRHELCSVDTEFAIGDRERLRASLNLKIKILDFGLKEVRRLQPFFRWLSIEDRYLSRCVDEKLIGALPIELRRWDLSAKAYHIARVGATFDSYGSSDDALSLYQRLRTVQIVEVNSIDMKLEIVQDDQIVQSDLAYHAPAYVYDCDDGLTIYVSRVADDQQLCFFSVLPRKLQEWLMQDPYRSTNSNSFEVTNVLTSIFASDASALDGILEDQGIVQVPFENQDVRGNFDIKGRLPGVDQAESRTLVIRERSS